MPAMVDLKWLLRAGANPVTYLDLNGEILTINEVGARNLGMTADEAVGRSIYDVLPEMADTLRARNAAVVKTGEPGLFEDALQLPDGERVFLSHVSPVFDADRRCVALHVQSSEVTELRETEQKLRAADEQRSRVEEAYRDSERRFTLAMEAVRDGVWDWNIATGDFELSNNFYALLGYSEAEIEQGRLEWFYGVLHPDDRPRIQTLLEDHFAGKTKEYTAEYRWKHKDGSWRWALARGKLVERGADGSPVRMLGTTIDVTERQQLETRLAEAAKMEAIGRLAGGVAHDFNNLLTTVVGHLEFLRSYDLDTQCREDLDQIGTAIDRASRLTTQLLSFARRRHISPKEVELAPLLVDLQFLLSDLLGADIELSIQIASPLPRSFVDPSQFEQIVVNLALNARDAMPRGGKLTFELGARDVDESEGVLGLTTGHYVVLTASDNGQGMDSETLEHVFEPFFTTKPTGKGTGLGLASSYGIVRQAGGQIAVSSELGRGTTFEVFLPVAPETSRPAPPSDPGAPVVLVAEDDDLVRATAVRALQRKGYRVYQAASGDQALALPPSILSQVDVLLTDVVMPGITGNRLAKQLIGRFPEIKVLFVSGYPHDAIIRHGVLVENADFIAKPFTPSALLEKLGEVLGRKR